MTAGGTRKSYRREASEGALQAVVLDADGVLLLQVEGGRAGAQVRKNSAVGTKVVDCSVGTLAPPGTSFASKPGPSMRMSKGVPPAVPMPCAVRSA